MNQPIKILLLEDNKYDEEIIHRIIKNEWPDCHWLHVSNKTDFVEALHNFKPDIILSDNDLPGFSGTEALVISKEQDPLIPFILVTGTVAEEFAINMLNAGADDYILKDRLTRLPSAIQTALKFLETEKEKKTMLDRLTASEIKYRELVERVTDGFMAVDASGNITYANTVAENFFNVETGGMISRRLGDILGIIDLNDLSFDLGDLSMHGKPLVKEVCCNLMDKWFLVNCYISETGGSIVLKDISNQRAAEMKASRLELKYKTFVDRITDGLIVIDRFWNYTYVNANAAILMRKSAFELVGKNVWDVFPEARDSLTYFAIQQALKKQYYVTTQDYYAPYQLWYEIHVYPSTEGVTVFLRDISIQKEQELEVREIHMRMTTILNSLPAHIVMIDPQGKILEANNSWYRFATEIGLQPQESGPGNNLFEIKGRFLPEVENGITTMEKTIQSMLAGNLDKFDYEFHFTNLRRWYNLTLVKLQVDHTDGAVVIFTDITEIKKLEAERISRDAEEQKNITKAVLEAQEKERDFIGSELHDNINQQLVGIQLALAGIKNKVQNDLGIVQVSLQNIKQVIVETRKLAHELVTPDFTHQSLRHLVEDVATTMLSVAGIQVLIMPENFQEKLLNSQQKIVLYRIVQEQCLNIVKHAKATSVELTLQIETRRCQLIIMDNGIGMRPTEKPNGIGMRNIRARLTLISGSLQTNTALGKGFTLKATFPINPDNMAAEP